LRAEIQKWYSKVVNRRTENAMDNTQKGNAHYSSTRKYESQFKSHALMDLLRNVGSLVISEGAKCRLSKPVLTGLLSNNKRQFFRLNFPITGIKFCNVFFVLDRIRCNCMDVIARYNWHNFIFKKYL
jgi:hypothetical protein